MDLHQRQQFDFLLHTAVERYAERLEQMNQGPSRALEQLRRDPESPSIRLSQFTAAVFDDFLLDNPEGAAFLLCALAARPAPAFTPEATIGASLIAMARRAFAQLLSAKTEELLEQHAGFEAAVPGD